ncbi:MAG: hypothetical protein U9R50_11355 [Campylobacterota bacterium]|nr:hypothetical protein [Campylobacterota bacterium]
MRQNKVGVPNWFKPFGHFNVIGFLLLGGALYAQSFEEFKQSQMKAYEDDKAQREREFRSFLNSEWKAYKESQGFKVYEKPKPKTLPSVVEKVSIPVGPAVIIKPLIKKVPIQKKEIEKKEVKIPQLVVKPIQEYDIVLFGKSFLFEKDKSLGKATFEPQNKQGITNFFDTLTQSNYQKTVDTLALHVKEHQLNDWALYLLSQKLSYTLYKADNEAKLFQWFMLNQLGYDIKVALQKSKVVVLSKSKKTIYSTPNYTLSKHHYYAIDYYNQKGLGAIRTYEGNYPDAVKSLNLELKEIPKFNAHSDNRELSFRYRGQKHTLHVKYNQNLINFMQTYPQADYDAYFNAPLDEESSRSLVSALKPIIDGKAASDAINILLYFVQHAFTYELDQEQFGREKVMFAQETLYYKKSDCEDRAVLFSYLVKNLLGYDVVGVKYSDHMATAVAVPMQGDALNIASDRYVIADPTYMNAPIGKSMPKYKNVRPEKYIRVD